MDNYDLIISPSFAGTQLTLTNLTGHPALSLPCGFDDKGNPTSFSLIGPLFSEGILCAVGELYQSAVDHHEKRPPMFNRDDL